MKLRIHVEGRTYEVEVEILEDHAADHHHHAPAPSYAPAPVASYTPPPAPAAAPAAPAVSGSGIPAPLAGTIRKIHVQPGQRLAVDDPVVTLEAMKMETPVSAPTAGVVKAILVKEGDAVQSGQMLLAFE